MSCSFVPPPISLLPISPQSPRNFKAHEYAPGRIRLLRLSPSPCRCDSEHSPQHPLSLRAGSPARVEMEIGLGRVKLLDVFICFLSSHLVMSLSPQADPSSEPKHAVLDKRGCCMANLRDCMLSEGQRGEPPDSNSPLRKLPCAAEGPGGGGGAGGGQGAGCPSMGRAIAYLGEPPPEAPGEGEYPPPLFLLWRGHADGVVGATTPSPPGTEQGCD